MAPTKRPWRYDADNGTAWGNTFIISGGYEVRGDVNHLFIGHALTEDDARLMTASPDLLLALEGITNEIAQVSHDHWNNWVARLQSHVITARAAIAKARPDPS